MKPVEVQLALIHIRDNGPYYDLALQLSNDGHTEKEIREWLSSLVTIPDSIKIGLLNKFRDINRG